MLLVALTAVLISGEFSQGNYCLTVSPASAIVAA